MSSVGVIWVDLFFDCLLIYPDCKVQHAQHNTLHTHVIVFPSSVILMGDTFFPSLQNTYIRSNDVYAWIGLDGEYENFEKPIAR